MSVQGVLRYIRERVQDATTTRKGVIKLAGDLGGTADSPSVRSLSPEVSVGLAGGGTGADLSATGPGALVQANAGDPVTVETLASSRGGTGVDNGGRTITIQTASANFVFTSGKTLTVSQSLILNGNSGATLWLNVNFTVGGNAGTLTFGAASKTLTVNESVVLDGASGKTLTLTGSLTVGADTSITGGGTVALGGYTLTVPATGTAALLATANTFTAAQAFGAAASGGQVAIKAASAGTVGLVVNTAASPTANVAEFQNNGTVMYKFANDYSIQIAAYDNGSSYGPYLTINRNNNGSTPAAGFMFMFDKGGTPHRVWVDDPGNLRISPTTNPTYANDTSGTVVGTQTSTLATKDLLGQGVAPEIALSTILRTPVHEFRYRSGAYNNSVFHGIVAEESPDFVMDEGRVFNPVSAFGFTVQAIKALAHRLDCLEGEL